MSKVILEGYVLVSDIDLNSVENELDNHINLTRQEEGCLVFEVTQDHEKPNRFNVYEEFASKEAFNYHQQRLSSTEWSKVSSKLEKHYKTSSVD